jgi:ElaB/YqjD/DUF883 family membrane-anchored ribosome-binding protein
MDSTLKLPPDTGTSPALAKIMDDIAALRRDLAGLASQLKNSAVQGAGDAAQHAVDQIGENARRIYGNLAEQGERSAKAIGRQVEGQPIISLLIAFAVGLVGGRFLSR